MTLGLDGKLSRACQHPDNLWSLHGLHECLVRRGDKVETALIKNVTEAVTGHIFTFRSPFSGWVLI